MCHCSDFFIYFFFVGFNCMTATQEKKKKKTPPLAVFFFLAKLLLCSEWLVTSILQVLISPALICNNLLLEHELPKTLTYQ